jgi:hypothetical protein
MLGSFSTSVTGSTGFQDIENSVKKLSLNLEHHGLIKSNEEVSFVKI